MREPSDDDWFQLIKSIRAEHGVGIHEAERRALADPVRRRWVEKRINADRKCRKLAEHHMAAHGQASLIGREGETLVVRV